MQNPDAPSASQILELAKSHVRPRKTLLEVAKEKAKAKEESVKKAEKNKSPPPAKDIPLDVKKLVMLTLVVPFLNTSGTYNLLGFNYRDGNAAKAEAIQKKLLIEHRFHPGWRGGQTVLLEPSEAAFAMFGIPPMFQNPGFIHRYMQQYICKAMTERGYKATPEKLVKGKRVDVVLEKDEKTTAIEIANTEKYELVNIEKNIQVGFRNVVVIGKDKQVIAAVRAKIQASFSEKVASQVIVCNLADFIDKHSR